MGLTKQSDLEHVVLKSTGELAMVKNLSGPMSPFLEISQQKFDGTFLLCPHIALGKVKFSTKSTSKCDSKLALVIFSSNF